ncbi:hypothetical protein DPEC_G00173050 [Dallia pectoralis]|uniref:Uncharacterized protein n=1 Tax=Dallia pectoralis TaxID=75939 RepID=A0ACC2GDP9_DALPE|nr:hypothetical protein DPEC_G00173050 [Dallia pectoralis]
MKGGEHRYFVCLFKMCSRVVGALSVLLCLGPHTEAKPKLSVNERLWVTLPGEMVSFALKLTTQTNQSAGKLVCRGPPDLRRDIQTWKIPMTATENTNTYALEFTARDSSYSGVYSCNFQTAEIFTVLLVQDKKFQKSSEMQDGCVVFGVLVTALLVFSVLTSICLFKQGNCTTKNKNDGLSKRKRRPKEEKVKISINADTSVSVYASLEPRPASVYEVVVPAVVQEAENCTSSQRKVKTVNATQREENVLSVYENY